MADLPHVTPPTWVGPVYFAVRNLAEEWPDDARVPLWPRERIAEAEQARP
jgi:hypothetical protein